MAMRMRQSLAQLEQQFHHESQLDRHRAERLRRRAVRRARLRSRERATKRSSARYWMLVVSLLLTAAIVAVGMFASLYLLLS